MKTARLALPLLLLAACDPSIPDGETDTDSGVDADTAEQTDIDADTEEPVNSTAPEGLSADEILDANANTTTFNDDEWDITAAVDVALAGTSATTAAAGVSVSSGLLTITQAGVYHLTGTFQGQVVVEAGEDDAVVLMLDGVTITNATGPAIAILQADDVLVHLVEGTTNTLTDTATFASDADIDATLYSEEDLTVSGAGTLIVNAGGMDGISSDDDLVILSGTIVVTAADDCLRGKDSLEVGGGTLTLTCEADGLKSTNDEEADRGFVFIEGGILSIDAGDDGINGTSDVVITGGDLTLITEDDAIHSDGYLIVEGGTIDILASYEGLEASVISVNDGDIRLVSSDDGLNAASDVGIAEWIWINGGTIVVDAQGDGLDANGNITVTGGITKVWGPSGAGNGSLDADGTIDVSGGVLLAAGGSSMLEAPDSTSAQAWISTTVSPTGSMGDEVVIRDASGTSVYAWTAEKTFAAVTFSSPDIVPDAVYTIEVNGSQVAEVTEGVSTGGGGRPGGGRP